MVKEVRWTEEAVKSFESVIEYLKHRWTEKEIEAFVISTNRIVLFISQNPKMFRITSKRNVREALVTPS